MKPPKKIYFDNHELRVFKHRTNNVKWDEAYHSDTAIKEWIEENTHKVLDGVIAVDDFLKFLNEQ